MTPESVGVKQTELVLGKHSGQHAFESRLRTLGYELAPEQAADLFSEAPIGNTDAILPVCSGDMLFNVLDDYLHFLR